MSHPKHWRTEWTSTEGYAVEPSKIGIIDTKLRANLNRVIVQERKVHHTFVLNQECNHELARAACETQCIKGIRLATIRAIKADSSSCKFYRSDNFDSFPPSKCVDPLGVAHFISCFLYLRL